MSEDLSSTARRISSVSSKIFNFRIFYKINSTLDKRHALHEKPEKQNEQTLKSKSFT